MRKSLRSALAAGPLLVVLALVVSACAANGAAAPSASTPSTSSNATAATSTVETTAEATSTGAGTSSATQPAETATSQPAATASGAEATSTTSSAMTPAAASTPETGATGTTTSTVGASTPVSGTTSGAATVGTNGISQVTYTAVEYSFQGPDQLPAGWTQITLNNQGKAFHDLQLYSIDAGKTLQDVTQALAANGPPDWAHAYGGTNAAAGSQGSYLVNLVPGNYVLLSFGDNQQGPPDAAKGMLKLITVAGSAPAAGSVQLPTPDVTINMVDYKYEMTGTLKSGTQTIYLTNTGNEIHEAQVLQLKPGTTFQQFQQQLMQSNGQQESQIPATPVWGMTLSPKLAAYGTAKLTPGEYAVVCFLPSTKNGGKPHYMLGMVSSFAVK